ncbi:hypothetical protein C3747_1g344 [Trypanosoma cruzi]|uniref:Uncharacterized protein n=2 Tax=Trypanosoma cruzi TaxID=5693 RepID=Q4DWW8_TRYCC|nr:hypothetical protein, conserved [Trypanosoma cruzi]EAN97026.1 hypothetical protein, conserved [Trypanosoma cruzi]PWV22165.1 hypothetical protein C3747_1g344 [Trypanosoma cruzi]RNC37563.1 hypothetical protein TcCL_NonESM13265 [Trypanosoma cruzi]|eukprot:XP_818877.1 hypothetical protein [Trypanosoma cruzi strain CL Brener]
MLDYFVAIGVALLGLLVVYFMFHSIKKSEFVAFNASKERKSRPRKTPKAPRRDDSRLDREMEALIAQEVAHHTTSMRADIRVVQPVLLENMQRKVAAEKNKAASMKYSSAASEQALIDKEMGFQKVVNQSKPRKSLSPPPPQRPQQANTDEELSRKLGQFFSNNRKDKKGLKVNLKEEQTANTKGNGVHVVVRKDISNARTWSLVA